MSAGSGVERKKRLEVQDHDSPVWGWVKAQKKKQKARESDQMIKPPHPDLSTKELWWGLAKIEVAKRKQG